MGTATAPETVAAEVVELLRTERFADLTGRFAPPLRAVASADTVAAAWHAEHARIGDVTTVGTARTEPVGGDQVRVIVELTAEHGALAVRMVVDDAGSLQGFRLAAPESDWTAPGYVNPKRFTEHEVTLGSGDHAVAGTVTVPRGRGSHPAVVLLASGPADRDASVGPNKPFKDLAWGLATRGVAVLRFDKITHTHPEIAADPTFTMADEFVPHGLAALDILRHTPGIDPGRIHLLGHSAGSAPRVATAARHPLSAGDPDRPTRQPPVRPRAATRPDPGSADAAATDGPGTRTPTQTQGRSGTAAAAADAGTTARTSTALANGRAGSTAAAAPVAGVILLAVATAPLPRAAVRVARHLAATEPALATPELVETMTRQAARAESPDLRADTPAADLPFGWTGAYWLDRNRYDAVAATAALDCPALILQGERDYQVTVADDFPAWRTGLAARPDATLRTYPGVDHMFLPGTGPSTAADYQVPAHVDGQVVADIAAWIRPPRTGLAGLTDRLRGQRPVSSRPGSPETM